MSIKVEHVSYLYGQGTAFEKKALDDVSLTLPDGQFLGIIGAYRIREVYPDPAFKRAASGHIRDDLL